MLVPLSWLKDYLHFPEDLLLSPESLSEVLTLAGLEVEGIKTSSLGFNGVVVAKVLKTEPHPQAERLKVATVTDGKDTYQVVCGGPNCREGLVTALAKVGAQLTDRKGEVIKIKKSKLRGVDSEGMLCAEEELGLPQKIEGMIIEFEDTLPLGKNLLELFGDSIFEISLTPNLGHCMSIRGIARELSTLLNLKMVSSKFSLNEKKELSVTGKIKVSIENPEQCLRYSCRYLENIEVKPSPEWLKNRLEACGLRSINNIVDATNYVLLEYGQPLHAFDYDKIEGEQIIVKCCETSLPFITLDAVERSLPSGALVICDEEKPLAIAGIMGGLHSSITSTTTRILLESAYFDPSSIRKTSKMLNVRTDSSSRFEKNIDPEAVVLALDRAALLIQEIAGGDIAEGVIDEKTLTFTPRVLSCRLKRINALLGTELSLNEVETLFHRLKLPCEVDSMHQVFHLKIPTYRNDIQEEIDLIEDIARVYGYNHIHLRDVKCVNSKIPHSPLYLIETDTRKRLVAEGLQEMLTCDLISPKLAMLALDTTADDPLIHVLHPSSVDQSILRPSLLPGLLQAIKHNFDHQTFSISAFEIGLIHYKEEQKFKEKPAAGIILTGEISPHFWGEKPKKVDIFDLKGIVENFIHGVILTQCSFTPLSMKGFHPGRQALINTSRGVCGFLGEVHPSLLEKLNIQEKVFFAEIDLQELFNHAPTLNVMSPLPSYPGSERDWTVTFKEEAPYQTILEHLKSISSRLLKQVSLLDLYRSEKLGSGKKNITLRFSYRDDQKTISLETVEKEHHRILALATQKLKDFLV
jgi:phenylalanyl-tRNA synthetase beta chain